MFGLFKKKPSNGWVRLRVGADIPAKHGQKFDVRLRGEGEVYGLIMGVPCVVISSSGEKLQYSPAAQHWSHGGRSDDVTHYRLHRPSEISSDLAARAERDNMFRDWLKDAESLTDNPYPAKRREGARQ